MDSSYPPNSGRAASPPPAANAEPRVVEQVTQAKVEIKKPPLSRKFKDTFISGDAKTTAGFVFENVILPQFKDLLVNSVTQGFERLVRGESYSGRRPPSASVFGGAPGRLNYNQMSQSRQIAPPQTPARQMTQQARQNQDFGQIQLESFNEAQSVLEGMYTLYGQYDYVTVADLYALTGTAANHTDRQWGWTDLRGSNPRRTRSGAYILDLPRPEWLGS